MVSIQLRNRLPEDIIHDPRLHADLTSATLHIHGLFCHICLNQLHLPVHAMMVQVMNVHCFIIFSWYALCFVLDFVTPQWDKMVLLGDILWPNDLKYPANSMVRNSAGVSSRVLLLTVAQKDHTLLCRIHVLQVSETAAAIVYVITMSLPPAHLAWPARPAIDEMRPLVAACEDGSLLGLDMEACADGASGMTCDRNR